MVKITLRRACLGAAALLLALFSLLALCFPVVRLDLANVLNGGEIGSLLESYGMSSASENGFALLGGDSGVIRFFNEFSVGFISSSGIEYHMTDLSGLEVFSQVFNIVILVISAMLVIGSVSWLFFMKGENLLKTIAIFAAWIGIIYMVEGLLFSLLMEAEWDKMLDLAAGSGAVFFGNMFSTLAYVPFILIFVFEAAFWTVYYRVKAADGEETQSDIAKVDPQKQDGSSERQLFVLLREYKKLLDEGVLTEQEFEKIKGELLREEPADA